MLLNSDVVAHRGWLELLQYGAYASRRVGIVGPKLLYPDGTIQSAGLDPQPRRARVVRPPLPLQAGRPPAGERAAARARDDRRLHVRQARPLDAVGPLDEGYGDGVRGRRLLPAGLGRRLPRPLHARGAS